MAAKKSDKIVKSMLIKNIKELMKDVQRCNDLSEVKKDLFTGELNAIIRRI